MGTKVYVSSVTYKLGDEWENIPDLVGSAIIGSLFLSGDQIIDVSSSIKEAILEGRGKHFEQLYRHAKDDGFLPTLDRPGTQATLTDEQIIGYIRADRNLADYPVDLVNIQYDADLAHHLAYKYLIDNYQYDWSTRTFNNPPFAGTEDVDFIFGKDRTVTFTFLDSSGLPLGTKQAILLDSGAALSLAVYYTYTKNINPIASQETLAFDPEADYSTVTTYGSETYNNTRYESQKTIVSYAIDGSTVTKTTTVSTNYRYPPQVWYYVRGRGNPTIDAALDDYYIVVGDDNYFPMVPLRVENKFIDDAGYTGVGKEFTVEERLEKIGTYLTKVDIDVKEVIEKMKANANIGDVDHAFVIFGVDLATPTIAGRRYLFEYFHYLFQEINPRTEADWNAWVSSNSTNPLSTPEPPWHTERIYTPSNEIWPNFDIRFLWAETRIVDGVLDAEYTTEVTDHLTIRFDGDEQSVCKMFFRKRLSDTQYEEYCFYGLQHINYVYKSKVVRTEAWETVTDYENNNGFLLPLNHLCWNLINRRWQNQLAYELQHILFNCYTIVKTKWYQSGWFKILVIIIAIVITVLSWGSASGVSAGMVGAVQAGLVAAGVSATIAAALAYLIVAVGVSLVARLAGRVATKAFGAKVGAIVQMIVYIVAMAYGVTGQPNPFAANPGALANFNTAVNILNQAMAIQLSFDAKDLMEKMQAFQALAETAYDRLEAAQNLLNLETNETVRMLVMERPRQFLARTVDTPQLTDNLIAPIEYLNELSLTTQLV